MASVRMTGMSPLISGLDNFQPLHLIHPPPGPVLLWAGGCELKTTSCVMSGFLALGWVVNGDKRERGQRAGTEPLAAGLCVPWTRVLSSCKASIATQPPTLGLGIYLPLPSSGAGTGPCPTLLLTLICSLFGKQSFDSVYLRLSKWSVPLASHQPWPTYQLGGDSSVCLNALGPAGSGGSSGAQL